MLPGCGATSYTGPASSLEHLEVERRRYLSAALATTSLQVYQTALTQYLHFCIQVGVNPYPLQEHVELFSTSLARRVGYKTIKAYLYGIEFYGICPASGTFYVAFVAGKEHATIDLGEGPSH